MQEWISSKILAEGKRCRGPGGNAVVAAKKATQGSTTTSIASSDLFYNRSYSYTIDPINV